MRVHIISDMEGVAGIVKWEQTTRRREDVRGGPEALTEEINAAVRGAKAGGATEIVVMDCHGAGGDWSFNSLHPRGARPRLRVRRPGQVDRVHRLPRGGMRRGALRRHAREGGNARRRHEPHGLGQEWQNLWFNGTLVGETGINAALCGQWGCPVLLVTGDDAVCREAKELLGDGVTTVAVKTGLSSKDQPNQ